MIGGWKGVGIIPGECFPHGHRHEQLLCKLLLAEGNRPASNHDALLAHVLDLGDLLDDGRQPS